MLTLRPYQEEALRKIKWGLTLEGNDVVQIPTGGGKSIVIAELANYLQQDILILQPSVEILEQNKAKLAQYVDESEIGVYSASAGEKMVNKYTFATIGSVYKVPELFAHFKIVIIDELHLLNPKATGSMFGQFLKGIGSPKVIGFTATPYRIFPTYFMGTDYRGNYGWVQRNSIKVVTRVLDKKGGERFWDRILYSIDAGDLIKQGYLSPLEYVDKTTIKHEIIPLNKGKTDFDLDAYDEIVKKSDGEVVSLVTEAKNRHQSVLVFCNSIAQSNRLATYFPEGCSVSSQTKPKEREDIIEGFKNGKYPIVFNVGVLTTGFDMPRLDCIVMLRPTQSISLYYQMLGRGTRLHPGKTSCTVYDWSGNVKKLGRMETIKLQKVEGKWNITTETKPEGWHGVELYRFVIKKIDKPSGIQY